MARNLVWAPEDVDASPSPAWTMDRFFASFFLDISSPERIRETPTSSSLHPQNLSAAIIFIIRSSYHIEFSDSTMVLEQNRPSSNNGAGVEVSRGLLGKHCRLREKIELTLCHHRCLGLEAKPSESSEGKRECVKMGIFASSESSGSCDISRCIAVFIAVLPSRILILRGRKTEKFFCTFTSVPLKKRGEVLSNLFPVAAVGLKDVKSEYNPTETPALEKALWVSGLMITSDRTRCDINNAMLMEDQPEKDIRKIGNHLESATVSKLKRLGILVKHTGTNKVLDKAGVRMETDLGRMLYVSNTSTKNIPSQMVKSMVYAPSTLTLINVNFDAFVSVSFPGSTFLPNSSPTRAIYG
ncbi:hypothetical protein EV360DRAFT_74348 [Lentinula raphanica]|nr:hypothetical protein EV360DRAFT_74348 [Lentinula raphanica]